MHSTVAVGVPAKETTIRTVATRITPVACVLEWQGPGQGKSQEALTIHMFRGPHARSRNPQRDFFSSACGKFLGPASDPARMRLLPGAAGLAQQPEPRDHEYQTPPAAPEAQPT